MNGNSSSSSLYFLIILVCTFAFLVLTAHILQAEEPRLIMLNDAIDIALKNNIELQRFSNQTANSEISVRQAKAAFFPDLSASASASQSYSRDYNPVTEMTENRKNQSLNIDLSTRLTLFDGFGNIASLQSAKMQLSGIVEDFYRARQLIIFETLSQYLQVLMDEELLASEEQNLLAQRQQLDRIDEFYQAGNRSIADVLQQRAAVAQAELRILTAEHNLNISKLQLLKTIGLGPSTEYEVDTLPREHRSSDLITDDVEGLLEQALVKRPDIQAQIMQVDAAERQAKAARSGY